MKKDTPKPVNPLTKRQAAALEYVAKYIFDNGYPPTIREIGDHMEIKSTNGVNDHLKAIERKGYIIREESKSRAIRPLFMPDKQPFDEWRAQQRNREDFNAACAIDEEMYHINLYGNIAAGEPITAIDNCTDTLRLGASVIGRPKDMFALKVKGQSMIEDGIHDGDTIFIERSDTAPEGSIVAVLIEDEATVKRLYHEEDGRIRLQPANSSMQPIYLTEEEARESCVIGQVVALFRKL